ncbi:putative nuclease HARBI1 [Dendronephthya gigantea]|uniref:putative nuclease HARBI1 n=1 Tax=Dendronephthya gigantea TaxID=151771 RepID=UPI001068D764|nr:putative nuclease HARBI1 [Dendronephthya gigantea]
MRADRQYRREIHNIFEYYKDDECRARYRFGKDAIRFIVNLVHNEIHPPTNRSYALSAMKQVLITLRFLATGSFLQVIGDTFAALHKSTISRVVRRVCIALARKLDQFVKFPGTREEKDEIKRGFYELAGFPCVVGCVDGSHIRIIAPSENEPNYINRKGYHSINVQGICDHKGTKHSLNIFIPC